MQPTVLLQIYVFVYGTLRRGELRDINQLQPPPVWQGSAQLPGVLYDLGECPGMVLHESASHTVGSLVHGEVYAVTPVLEQQLDAIEGLGPQPTGEYRKCETAVWLPQSQHWLRCSFYEATPAFVAGKPVIADGDWVRFRLSLPNGPGQQP